MKKIVSLLIVMLLAVVAVNAQTSESKRKPKPTTTQTTAPKPAPKPVQTTTPKPAPKPVQTTAPRPVQTTTQNNHYSGEKRTFTANGVSFTMVYVQGGTFTMGATSEQGSDAESDEKSTHSVTLSSFSIGETEVTQALWQAVMGNNPSSFKGNTQRPVEQVSWNDCQEFIRKLNSLTDKIFRMPTEAEWEYAARGGDKSRGYKYSGSNNIGDVAWYDSNSYSKGSSHPDYGTHPVKQKQANELGLYDMSGNVMEWCSDWYDENYYRISPNNNPKGPSSGSGRVDRGGGWTYGARSCRSSRRDGSYPDRRNGGLGLRLVLSEF